MKIISFLFVFLFAGIFPLPHSFAQNPKGTPPTIEKGFEQEEEVSEYRKEIIANDFFEKAFKASNDTDKIRYYKKAVELDPNCADAYNNLGIIHKKLKMYDLAFDFYNKALQSPSYRKPEYTHNNLGVLHRELESYDKAIKQFKKAIALAPSFVRAWNNLGMVYKSKGDFYKAIECFQKALKLDPNYLQAEENLKNVWKLPDEKSTDQKEIEKTYTNALKLFHEGKYKEAIFYFQKVKKVNPDFGNVKADLESAQNISRLTSHINKAVLMTQRGSIESAREELQLAIKFAETKESKITLKKKFDELKQLEEEIAKNKQLDSFYRNGLAQLQQKNWLKAISLFTRAVLVNPDYKEALMRQREARIGFYLADASEKINHNQWEDAKTAYQNLLKIDPQNQEALKTLEKLSQIKDKANIDFHLRQAEEAVNFQDFQGAEKNFKKVLTIDPENMVAQKGMQRIVTLKSPGKTSPTKVPPLNKRKIAIMGGAVLAVILALIFFFRILKPGKVLEYYRNLKDSDKTRTVYERILDSDPKRRRIYPSLAAIYYRLKLQEKLPTLLDYCRQQQEEAEPEEAPLWQLCLGEIYLESKQLQQAREELEKAYEMSPRQEGIIEKLTETYDLLLQENPENSTWETRRKQLRKFKSGEELLPIPQKSSLQNIATMDDESKRALLKECFGKREEESLPSPPSDNGKDIAQMGNNSKPDFLKECFGKKNLNYHKL